MKYLRQRLHQHATCQSFRITNHRDVRPRQRLIKTCLIKSRKILPLEAFCYVKARDECLFCPFILLSFDALQAAYHRFPEELVLGVVFAENEPRVTFERPGRLNLQHNLVVLQTPLWGETCVLEVILWYLSSVYFKAESYPGPGWDGAPGEPSFPDRCSEPSGPACDTPLWL